MSGARDVNNMSKKGVSDPPRLIIPECNCCKRTIVKHSVKCSVCNKFYHPGCAIKTKRCCEEEISTTSDFNSGDISPLSDSVNKIITSESTQVELLMKIIFELEGKNTILAENNSLLKYKISSLESELTSKNSEIYQLNKKIGKQINTVNKKSNIVPTYDRSGRSEAARNSTVNTVTDTPNCSIEAEVPNIVLTEASTSTAPTKLSAKETYAQAVGTKTTVEKSNASLCEVKERKSVSSNQKHGQEWSVVSHKRTTRKRKALVIGSFSGDSTVEGIDKFKALHVSNLKPETSVENLQNFLKKNFTNIQCEKLISKYPESYSSFKVLVPESEYEKALVGSIWPNKASVRRFFQPRKVKHPGD